MDERKKKNSESSRGGGKKGYLYLLTGLCLLHLLASLPMRGPRRNGSFTCIGIFIALYPQAQQMSEYFGELDSDCNQDYLRSSDCRETVKTRYSN